MKNFSNNDYKAPDIGSIIVNDKHKYEVIGHGKGLVKVENDSELPLSEIDKKILRYFKANSEHNNIFLEEHQVIFSEDELHACGETCDPLSEDIEKYIDNVVKEIYLFSDKHENKWTRNYYTLGFYKPFHFYHDWGIYLKATGLAIGTDLLKRRVQSDPNQYGYPSDDTCYLILKTFFFFHEFYHHKIESLAVRFELTTRLPYYTKGFHCLYCKTFNTDRCLEEAFANTYAYFETYKYLYQYLSRMGITAKQFRYILKKLIIKKSPPGYRLAEKIISANDDELAKHFEYSFFEILLRYSHKLITGLDLTPIDDETFWKYFKHATHPILFTENDVNYIVDLDDLTKIQIRNILIN